MINENRVNKLDGLYQEIAREVEKYDTISVYGKWELIDNLFRIAHKYLTKVEE